MRPRVPDLCRYCISQANFQYHPRSSHALQHARYFQGLKQNANEPAWRSTASDMSCSRTRTAEIRQTVWSVAVASLMLSRSQIWAGVSLGFPTRLCLVSHSSIFVTLYHVCFMYRYIQYYSLCIRCSMGPSHETRKEQDVAPMELLKESA
jgi:hypothetical protein